MLKQKERSISRKCLIAIALRLVSRDFPIVYFTMRWNSEKKAKIFALNLLLIGFLQQTHDHHTFRNHKSVDGECEKMEMGEN